MTTLIPIQHVVEAQHLRCLVRGQIENTIGDLVMDVYTGWFTWDHDETDQTDRVKSFVPLGTGLGAARDVQEYAGGVSKLSPPIVSASISSFAGEPDTAAVNWAAVKLVPINVSDSSVEGGRRPALVLVLEADFVVTGGKLHRVSYQVTVLATPKEPSTGGLLAGQAALNQLANSRLALDDTRTPPA